MKFPKLLKSYNHIGLADQLKVISIVDLFSLGKENVIIVMESHNKALEFYRRVSYLEEDAVLISLDNIYKTDSDQLTLDMLGMVSNSILDVYKASKSLIVTTYDFLEEDIPSFENIEDAKIEFESKKRIIINDTIRKLISLGYRKEPFVEKSGDFAVRGYIVDIFPINEKEPYRIELFGEFIEKIKVFDIETQTSSSEKENFLVHGIFDSVKKESKLSKLNNSKYVYVNVKDSEIVNTETNYYLSDFDNKYINIENIYLYSEKIHKTDIKKIIDNKENKVLICFDDLDKSKKELRNKEKVNFIERVDQVEKQKLNILVLKIIDSFKYEDYYFISKYDYLGYGSPPIVNKKFNFKKGTLDHNKIDIGDFVVHETHGIGKYVGIKKITKNKIEKEYLQINYRGKDKIYLPVEKINTLYKFSNENGSTPILSSLSSGEWAKTKSLARKKAGEITKELLESYVNKKTKRGFSFGDDDQDQLDFEKDFPYEYTIDQYKVTEEIKKDMKSAQPMNRLLCGDVGFGKTEVAFRAIFKAVNFSKQVMFLCPTTILSNQHYENAKIRFRNFPVNIRLLNRFVTATETKKIHNEIKEGKVDIVIGTHKLLNENISFKSLGLMVIDEEQRFGVKHKEILDGIRNNVDVISLSATPIPRTIQLTMAGVKSLSLIETPPLNRHPIQTYVCEFQENIIKDAIEKELARNGQIFIINNNIKKMDEIKLLLSEIVPQAKISTVHGQQNKSTIERVMNKFLSREFDVLISTTIIETGIDIPTVNTMIILDADNFGLSQLYQIRGRVGRSEEIAYCYLMYKKHKVISEIAEKRLKAIKDFTRLGSGFSIAMRDLSLRGAGDLLGKEQSGFIASVGVTMFMKMIEEEIQRMNGLSVEEPNEFKPLIEVKTSLNDFDNQDIKIKIHKMINAINSEEDLENTYNNIKDIFGHVDKEVLVYMKQEVFEKSMARNFFSSIKQNEKTIDLYIRKDVESKLNISDLSTKLFFLNRNIKTHKILNQKVITLKIDRLDKHYIDYLLAVVKIIEKELLV
jgi:transcription-repair coupling factor (superfamily II helicase)